MAPPNTQRCFGFISRGLWIIQFTIILHFCVVPCIYWHVSQISERKKNKKKQLELTHMHTHNMETIGLHYWYIKTLKSMWKISHCLGTAKLGFNPKHLCTDQNCTTCGFVIWCWTFISNRNISNLLS